VIPLSADSVAPCFEIAPAPLDFGPTPLGCSRTRTITAFNSCEVPLTLGEATVLDGPFSLSDAGSIVTLGLGEQRSEQVTFTPTTLGPTRGWLSVSLNQGTRLHQLDGEGVAAAPVTESFVQRGTQTIDILFVASGMNGAWANDATTNALNPLFRSRMAGSIDALADAGVDLHAAVISGHWDREVWELGQPPLMNLPPPPWTIGQLIEAPGFVGVFTTSSPSAGTFIDSALYEATWRAYMADMNMSSCFEAALRALTPPLSGTLNGGFRRPGVALAIFCQTFEGDVSTHFRPDQYDNPPTTWATPLPVPYYWQRLSTAAGGAQLLTISAIAKAPTASCFFTDHQGRLEEMASLSGGSVIDACDQEPDLAIDRLTRTVQAQERRYLLRGRPSMAAPMSVRVNGANVPSTDWRYASETNTLELTTAPAAEAQIEITYTPACD
jgi:hypothetical protein